MAIVYENGIKPIPMRANADLSSYQYCFVELAGSATEGYVDLCSSGSTTYAPCGILQNDPESGAEASVLVDSGFSKLKCAAPGTRVLVGHWLTSNASGAGVVTTTASLAWAVAYSNGNSSASSFVTVKFGAPAHLTQRIA